MHASDPVNRIMTRSVLTVGANELLEEALRLSTGYPVHHLPVVEDGHVVGMLSSADIAKLKLLLPPPGPAREALLRQRWQVRNIMRSPALTVTEHESTQRAAQLMADNGLHSLPVVNSKGVLIGIVTKHACRPARALRQQGTRQLGAAFAASSNVTIDFPGRPRLTTGVFSSPPCKDLESVPSPSPDCCCRSPSRASP
jgi:CBS domain-containing membrane protein